MRAARFQRRIARLACGLGLGLGLLATAPAMAAEAYFEVTAAIDSFSLDAEIEAAGRLSLDKIEDEAGEVTYRLERVLEAPWKLYAVDPVGPTGDEIKLAAVVTLDEPTWPAVERSQDEVRRFGDERYRAWRAADRVDGPFDGAYAFTVLGDPSGRFAFQVDASGTVSKVDNRLTHRWRNGPLDPLLAAWRSALERGESGPEGFWFWNEGEAEPFDWQPNTYRAFAAALELLGQPARPPRWARTPGDAGTVDYPAAVSAARRVFETLVPKAEGRLAGRGDARLRVTSQALASGGWRLRATSGERPLESGRTGGTYEMHRDTTLAPDGAVIEDRLEIRVASGGARLRVEVGYGPPS